MEHPGVKLNESTGARSRIWGGFYQKQCLPAILVSLLIIVIAGGIYIDRARMSASCTDYKCLVYLMGSDKNNFCSKTGIPFAKLVSVSNEYYPPTSGRPSYHYEVYYINVPPGGLCTRAPKSLRVEFWQNQLSRVIVNHDDYIEMEKFYKLGSKWETSKNRSARCGKCVLFWIDSPKDSPSLEITHKSITQDYADWIQKYS